jgi:hypothetical protein
VSRARASLPLFDAAPAPRRVPPSPSQTPRTGRRRDELWLCLLFPRLPLETRSAGEPETRDTRESWNAMASGSSKWSWR